MKLTKEQEGLFFKKVYSHLENKACFVCDNKNWAIAPEVFGLVSYTKNSESVYPMIAVSCDNCGYTLNFNPKFLGII